MTIARGWEFQTPVIDGLNRLIILIGQWGRACAITLGPPRGLVVPGEAGPSHRGRSQVRIQPPLLDMAAKAGSLGWPDLLAAFGRDARLVIWVGR